MSLLRRRCVVALATCLGVSACGIQLDSELEENAKAKKSAEQVAVPETPSKVIEKKTPEPTPAPGPVTRLPLVPQKSNVSLVVLKATGEHEGRFGVVTGHLERQDGKFTGLEVRVETSSLLTDVDAFGAHVRSAEFLNVKEFPIAVFRASSISKAPDQGRHQYRVVGDIELHGVRKAIDIPATIEVRGRRVDGEAKLTLRPEDFGLPGKKLAAEMIEGVELRLKFRFIAPAAQATHANR